MVENEEKYLLAEVIVNDLKEGLRIDSYLQRHFPETARTRFQKQVKEGLILLNGSPTRKNEKVYPGDQIKIYTPYRSKIEWLENEEIQVNIIYEDEDIILVNKEAGLQVHPASGNYNNTLVNGLLAYLKKKGDDLFLVHRLDKFTSGLILFAKNEESQEKLSLSFSSKSASRKYQALTWGSWKSNSTIKKAIGRSKKNPKRFEVLSIAEGGKNAITHYKIIQTYPFHTHIECELETGRTHQIRVHVSSENHPLVGDWEYGGEKILFGLKEEAYFKKMDKLLSLFDGQALVAKELSFTHPTSGKEMHFEIDLPENFKKAIDLLEDR